MLQVTLNTVSQPIWHSGPGAHESTYELSITSARTGLEYSKIERALGHPRPLFGITNTRGHPTGHRLGGPGCKGGEVKLMTGTSIAHFAEADGYRPVTVLGPTARQKEDHRFSS